MLSSSTFTPYLYIALGGALGSMARYWLSTSATQAFVASRLPIGTLLVNLLGCFLAGLLAGIGDKHSWLSDTRAFVFVGLMGGFTTFSAFGLETMQLLRNHDIGTALLYVGLSIFLGLLLLWAGFYLIQNPH